MPRPPGAGGAVVRVDDRPDGRAGDRERAVFLLLSALYEVASEADKAPVTPSLALRAMLAALHVLGDGDRSAIDAFWREVRAANGGQPSREQADYMRGTASRTAWNRIARSAGHEPDMSFMQRIFAMVGRRGR